MVPTLSNGTIEVYPLDRFNWEAVALLNPKDEQRNFLPDNQFSIAQSRFETGSELFGIRTQNQPCGMVICLVQTGGILWISRIMVKAEKQGQGIGRQALKLILRYQNSRPGVREIRTSVAESNLSGIGFFAKNEFRPLGAPTGGEVVLKWEGKF